MNLIFAWRYFRSKKSTNAINIIAWITVLAMAVGTAALILVLSVFNGFESLVKNMYTDFYADIRIEPKQGKILKLNAVEWQQIAQTPGVQNVAATIEEKAVLVNDAYQSIVYLKGVDEAYRHVTNLQANIVRGGYELGDANIPKIILGIGIENALALDASRALYPITVFLPNKSAKSFGADDGLHAFNIHPSGTFKIQQEFDNQFSFTNLAFMRYMLDLQADEYSAVELKLTRSSELASVQEKIEKIVGAKANVLSRYQQNQSLYNVMKMEKWIIYIILSLILIIAAFNMIGALTLLVLEKKKDIAVLSAMGMSYSGIQKIFLTEGFLLAGIGAGVGMVFAWVITLLQLKYHFIPLEGNSFVIDYYPVKPLLQDYVLVVLTVCIIALVGAWLPAKKAASSALELKSE